jgi:hypothetical protein
MVVSQDVRGQGVGRALSQETLRWRWRRPGKLSVQMTVDQQAAITLFESLGFKAEALLRDHVRDVDGKSTISSCSGTMWRRFALRWKPMGCPARCSTRARLSRQGTEDAPASRDRPDRRHELESSAEYYRIINREVRNRLGGVHSARSLMWSVRFRRDRAAAASGQLG